MDEQIAGLIRILQHNNISAFYVRDSDEALRTVLAVIPEGAVVGYGDSLTLQQIGLVEALENGPYTFLNPWKEGNSIEDNIRLKRQSLTADVFVTGSNAITLDGKIVNVDGHGNRVAAMLFGPEKVIIVVGINKVVENLEAALARIREVAAPRNVQRHAHFAPAPPCGATGVCSDCSSPWRICNKLVIIEREFNNDRYRPRITVVIVGKELGL
ncbi:MAG: lactate utilization protein [Chloroflexi bacterium]|nr:lactate utilization protein [Chloroflexota bacterium]